MPRHHGAMGLEGREGQPHQRKSRIAYHVFGCYDSCPEKERNGVIRLLSREWPDAMLNHQGDWPTEPAGCEPITIIAHEDDERTL